MTDTGPAFDTAASDPNAAPDTVGSNVAPAVEDAAFGLSKELARARLPLRLTQSARVQRQHRDAPVDQSALEALRSIYGMDPQQVAQIQEQLVSAGVLRGGAFTPGIPDKTTENAWREIVVRGVRSGQSVEDTLDAAVSARQAAGLGPEETRRRGRQGALGGSTADIAAQQDRLRTIAGDYLIPVSDATINHWIQSGATEGDFTKYAQDMAKGRFSDPNIVSAIDRGISPRHYFEPLVQTVAHELEISPDQVDLVNDPKFSKITDVVDEKGARRPMTLNEAQVYARSMPEWQHTQSAVTQAAAVGKVISDTFGRTAG